MSNQVFENLESFVVEQRALGRRQIPISGLVAIANYLTKTTDFAIPVDFIENLAERTGGVYISTGQRPRIAW